MSRVTSRLAAVICGAVAQATAFAAIAEAVAGPAPSHPFAAPESIGQPVTPGAGGLAQVTLALLVVLVAVFAVAWVVRRMRGFGNRTGGAIDVIADIPLGAKERAVARFESAYLALLMRRCAGNLSLAAREAGLTRNHLRDLLKKRGIYGASWLDPEDDAS